MTLNTAENAVKKTLGNRFQYPLDFEYFKQPVLPYYLHEDLVVTIELNKPEKVMLCSGDTAATYTISELHWNMTHHQCWVHRKGICSSAKQFIPIYKGYKIILSNTLEKGSFVVTWSKAPSKEPARYSSALSRRSRWLWQQSRDVLQPTIKKVNVTIDGDPHQLFKGAILPRNMFPKICKKFYRENSDVAFSKYLTTKYALWIDLRSLRDSKLHGSGRLVNSGVKLQIDKVVESSGNLTCYIFAVQDAYAHPSDKVN